MVRERNRGADSGAFVDTLVQPYNPTKPHLPGAIWAAWDNAPPHWMHAARDIAPSHLIIAWLPFRSPELMPCEDVWWEMKRTVTANRAYDDVDELAERAVAWLDDCIPTDILRLSACSCPSSNGYLRFCKRSLRCSSCVPQILER